MHIVLNENLEIVDDLKDTFEDLMGDVSPKEYSAVVENTATDNTIFHKNYMDYLSTCYGSHYGYVISPELIWYMLLCEVSGHIKEFSTEYASLFTETPEKKQRLAVMKSSDSPETLDLTSIVDLLKAVVPSDISSFLPTFTTDTPESTFAHNAAFCDAMSPYYDYAMYCCGFPSVTVKGTVEDWQKIIDSIGDISSLLPEMSSDYTTGVQETVQNIINSYSMDAVGAADFFNSIFTLERCGSGGQVEVNGWITKFYMNRPMVKYTHNYSTHVSHVEYKDLDTDIDYVISTGIFGSTFDEETQVATPNFSHVVYRISEEENSQSANYYTLPNS